MKDEKKMSFCAGWKNHGFWEEKCHCLWAKRL